MTISNAKREAIRRYDDKTYRKISIALRVDDDKRILESLDKAKSQGQTLRGWLNELFEKATK